MATAVRKVNNCIKTIAFLTAVLSVQNACAEPKDVFLHPNDNAYALDKIAVRPFLQRTPIRPVWNSGAIDMNLLEFMYNFNVPDQNEEQQFNALLWAQDAEERKGEFDAHRADALQEIELIADLGSTVFPEIEDNAKDFFTQIDNADLEFSNALLDYESKKEMVREADALADYAQGRTGQALIDLEYARLGAGERKADAAVTDALLEHAEEPTDEYAASDDVYMTETAGAAALKNFDLAILGATFGDLEDLSTMLDVTDEDRVWWERSDLGLDTPHISAKILAKQNAKRWLELIKNAMEGEK